MGVVLVGPSGCGKTTIWKVLKRAHEKLGVTVKTHIMNPKSMPRSQLLGNMNNDTREFSEGVLTASARQVVKEASEVLNWIICDGDIDPEWIESLNSVLDDNHLLTLPTGERISFGDNVNFIFETSDLQYASPATVSRMGMIFLNNEDISVKSLISRWVSKLECPEDLQKRINDWIEQYFYVALEHVTQFEESQIVATTRIGLVLNVLSQMQRLP
jgi:dynein heavy chain 2